VKEEHDRNASHALDIFQTSAVDWQSERLMLQDSFQSSYTTNGSLKCYHGI